MFDRTTPTEARDAKKALLLEVITAMCHFPQKIQVNFIEDMGPTTLIKIIAHPKDVNILVGYRGQVIDGIAKLARLLWAGKSPVEIMDIESTDGSRSRMSKDESFVRREDWAERKLVDLVNRIGKSLFPESDVRVSSEPQNQDEQWFVVTIVPKTNPKAVDEFSAALNKVMLPVGKNHGRKIYAGVKR